MAHRIVVGVDGSACSRLALQWGAREARIQGATLVVVTAWTFPHCGQNTSSSSGR